MTVTQFAFMRNQMAQMKEEMRSEFSGEQNTVGPEMYNDDTSDDEMSDTARSQSISAKLNRLTLEEGTSSSSRSPNHGSSSTAGNADESSRHFIISGDYTEVNDNYYQIDFDSHKVENNVIVNSFGEGNQGDNGVWRVLDMFIRVS